MNFDEVYEKKINKLNRYRKLDKFQFIGSAIMGVIFLGVMIATIVLGTMGVIDIPERMILLIAVISLLLAFASFFVILFLERPSKKFERGLAYTLFESECSAQDMIDFALRHNMDYPMVYRLACDKRLNELGVDFIPESAIRDGRLPTRKDVEACLGNWGTK